LGNVFVVIVEGLRILGRKAGLEHGVIVADELFQLVAGVLVAIGGRRFSCHGQVRFISKQVAIGIPVVFIYAVREYGGNLKVVLSPALFGGEQFIVLDQDFNAGHAEDGREFMLVCLAVVVEQTVIDDLFQPFVRFQQFAGIDVFNFDVDVGLLAFVLFVTSDVFNGKFQDILILDGVG